MQSSPVIGTQFLEQFSRKVGHDTPYFPSGSYEPAFSKPLLRGATYQVPRIRSIYLRDIMSHNSDLRYLSLELYDTSRSLIECAACLAEVF